MDLQQVKQRFGIIGNSAKLNYALQTAMRVASTELTVYIQGESGSGKESFSKIIHHLSPRKHGPFIAINCGALPEGTINSELFGHDKGAFTGAVDNRKGYFESANGGTIFLDEIGELPASAQARLLRFIQEGEIRRIGSVESSSVNVRLICATHRNLIELENTDAFRRDLFHRINVLRLELPPLRERGDDIQGLTNWLIRRVASRLEYAEKSLSDEARSALNAHDWPGNVRELEHTIERALVMSEGEEISLEDLSLPITSKRNSAMSAAGIQPVPVITPDTSHTPPASGAEELSLEDYFQRFVLENQDAMNETELAQKLGISRKCLWERRQRFDLPRKRKRGAA